MLTSNPLLLQLALWLWHEVEMEVVGGAAGRASGGAAGLVQVVLQAATAGRQAGKERYTHRNSQ